MVYRPLPLVQALCAARLVAHVEPRRGRDVMRRGDLEVLLTVTFLTRLKICQVQIGRLRVVERHVVHTVGIGIVGACELEIGALRAVEVVERHGRLSQSAERHVTHTLQVIWIVYAPVVDKRVERHDVDAVQVAVHGPREIGQRADRVVEQIRLQRPLYASRTCRVALLLPLVGTRIVGVDAA